MSEHLQEMIALAIQLWGEPTQKNAREMRFGRGRGQKLDLQKEVWHDKTSDQGGGYPQLYKLRHGRFPPDDRSRTNGSTPKRRVKLRPKPKGQNGHTQDFDWVPITPTSDTPRPTEAEREHYQLGTPSVVYEYVTPTGGQWHYALRFQPEGQPKQIRPLSYGVFKGVKGWHFKACPEPRPLFRLDAITQRGDRKIIVVEGEKAAVAGEQLFPEYVFTTFSMGASADGKTDFSPLGDGTDVILWPDADVNGHSQKTMQRILALLPQAQMVNIEGLPDKYDAADLAADDKIDHEQWLRDRIYTPAPEEPEHELPPIYWEDQRTSDWAGVIVPEMEWIMPGWIPAEQLTGLYGVGGINKTDFMLQLLMARSRGLPFCGFQLEASPVYGLFCEDTAQQIVRRIDRIALHYGLTRADFPQMHWVSLVGYDEPELMIFDQDRKDPVTAALLHIDKRAHDLGARLVTLDMGDHFFGGDPLRNRDIIRFVRKLDGISVSRKFGMLMSRHPSQRGRGAGGRMESGSVGWEGCMRARIGLDVDRTSDTGPSDPYRPEPVGEGRSLILWKSNYSKAGVVLDLVCKNGVFTTAALDPEKAKARGSKAAVKAACQEKFIDLLRALSAIGKRVHDSATHPSNYAPVVFAKHPDGTMFRRDQYELAMRELEATGKLRYLVKKGQKFMVEVITGGSEIPTDG